MKRKAIILAAGLGNRISAVARTTPKPLLSLNGRADGPTFLDWHLQHLSSAGVSEIFLVGNKKTFQTKLLWEKKISKKTKVHWILNPTDDLSTSGSAHSTWFAFEDAAQILDGRSDVLLMDADIVYDPKIFKTFFNKKTSSSRLLVCSKFRETDEEVMVFGTNGTPRLQGKGLLNTPMVEGMECFGEATGILLFKGKDHERLRKITCWVMKFSGAKTRSEHEDLTQWMMHLGKMALVQFDRELFMEVDTPEEYAVLTRKVFPKLSLLSEKRI